VAAAVKANAEHRAENLRAIVDNLRSQGFTSVRTIASQLNERGILTPRGGAWHPTSAARLLSRLMSALPPKADIRHCDRHVRFVPKADSCTAAICTELTTSIAGFSPVADGAEGLRNIIIAASLARLLLLAAERKAQSAYSMHSSQGFHDSAIGHPNNAEPRIVQVDRHPQGSRKNDPVNRVEQSKPAAHTTIAKA